jgi:ribonucleotide monophosphatase NagD (HAD superfamily)
MTGWDESTVIHVFNKAETGHPDLERIRTERPNVILVGDNINDADMASGDENVIRVRIVDTGVTSTDDDATVRHSTAERFDAMIKDGDMKPLMALIERIAHYTDVE